MPQQLNNCSVSFQVNRLLRESKKSAEKLEAALSRLQEGADVSGSGGDRKSIISTALGPFVLPSW